MQEESQFFFIIEFQLIGVEGRKEKALGLISHSNECCRKDPRWVLKLVGENLKTIVTKYLPQGTYQPARGK